MAVTKKELCLAQHGLLLLSLCKVFDNKLKVVVNSFPGSGS